MTTLTDRPTNTGLFFVFGVLLVVTAIGMLKFGSAPMIALCVLPWIVALFQRHPMLLVSLWPVLLGLDIVLDEVKLRLAGFVFLPMDFAYFFTFAHLLVIAVMRPEAFIKSLKENRFLTLFLVIILVYIVLYTPVYGKSAIGEARKYYFDFFFPLLAMVTIQKFEDFRQLLRLVFFVAVGLTLLALLRFGMGQWMEFILPAEGALVLLFAAFSILVCRINGTVITSRGFDIVMLGLFLAIVVMTQHRSVWLAGAAGLVVLFVLHRDRILFFAKAVMAAMALLGIVGAAMIGVPKFEYSVTKSLGGILNPSEDKNASWRMRGWQQQLDRIMGKDLWFGEGLGGYYSWLNRKTEVTASPHNGYIQTVLKFGVLGLAVYGLLTVSFFYRNFRFRKKVPSGPMRAYVEMGILNFAAGHAFLVGYDFSLIMLVFVALAMSAVHLLDNSRRGPAAYQTYPRFDYGV